MNRTKRSGATQEWLKTGNLVEPIVDPPILNVDVLCDDKLLKLPSLTLFGTQSLTWHREVEREEIEPRQSKIEGGTSAGLRDERIAYDSLPTRLHAREQEEFCDEQRTISVQSAFRSELIHGDAGRISASDRMVGFGEPTEVLRIT